MRHKRQRSLFPIVEDRFEPDFEAPARAFVRDDYVRIDIGGNIGMKTILLSQIAQRGHVVAMEAGPMWTLPDTATGDRSASLRASIHQVQR